MRLYLGTVMVGLKARLSRFDHLIPTAVNVKVIVEIFKVVDQLNS